MGQGCSGSLGDTTTSTPPLSQAAALQLLGTNGVASRKAINWKLLFSSKINEITDTLSPEDTRLLLWTFRSRCYTDRNLIAEQQLSSAALSQKGKGASKSDTVAVTWQRVTLNRHQLYSLFPSLHAHNLAQLVQSIRQLRGSDDSVDECREGYGYIEGSEVLRLITAEQLLGAFQCAEYLFNPRDSLDASASQGTLSKQNSLATSAGPPNGATPAPSVANLLNTSSAAGTSNNNIPTWTASRDGAANSAAGTAAVGGRVLSGADLLFQDFCFAIALCRCDHAMQEKLAFIYALFAEAGDGSANAASFMGIAADRSAAQLALQSQASSARVGDSSVASSVRGGGTQQAQLSTVSTDQDSSAVSSPQPPPVGATTAEEGSRVAGTGAINSAVATGQQAAGGATEGVELSALSRSRSNTVPWPQPSSAAAQGPNRMFSFNTNATPKPLAASAEKSALERLRLTETGALRLLLFLQVQLLKRRLPALALALAKGSGPGEGYWLVSRPAWVVRRCVGLLDLQDSCGADAALEQALQSLARGFQLLRQQAAVGQSQQQVGVSVSFAELLRAASKDTVSAAGGDREAGCDLLDLRGVAAGVDTAVDTLLALRQRLPVVVETALEELANEVLGSANQAMRLAISHFSASYALDQLRRCLPFLGTDRPLPIETTASWELFPLEARWFFEWCRAVGVRPSFLPAADSQRSATVKSKKTKNKLKISGRRDEFACFRHLVVGLLANVEAPVGLCAASVRRLSNTQLLHRNLEGSYHLLPPPALVPYRPGAAGQPDATLQYVLVPYELGRHLYERYDPQASAVPAAAYRRLLRFASTARPIEDRTAGSEELPASSRAANGHAPVAGPTPAEIKAVALNGSKDILQQTAGPTAVQLVRNLQASLTAQLETCPWILPLHMCSPLGVATAEPLDVLRVTPRPANIAYGPSSCEVTSMVYAAQTAAHGVVTVQDFLDLVDRRCLGSSSGGSAGNSCRLWGLYRTESTSVVETRRSTAPRLQHSPQREWRLLAMGAQDLHRPLAGLLAPGLVRPVSARGQSRNGIVPKRPVDPDQWLLGLMVEHATAAWKPGAADTFVWPTERVLAGQGVPDPAAVGADSGGCPFKISEQVDMLTDENKWVVGVVTNILRESALVAGADSALSVRYAVRPLREGEVRHPPQPIPAAEWRQRGSVIASNVGSAASADAGAVSERAAQDGKETSAHVGNGMKQQGVGISVGAAADGGVEEERPLSGQSSVNAGAAGRKGSSGSSRHDEALLAGDHYNGDENGAEEAGDEEEASDVESAIGRNSNRGDVDREDGEGLLQQHSLLASSLSYEEDSGESGSEDDGSDAAPTVTKPKSAATGTAVGAAVANGAKEPTMTSAPVNEHEVSFSPNGVTYAPAPGATTDAIVVPYDSVRILRLGTMTTLPSSLVLFEGGAISGSLPTALMEYAHRFESEAQSAQAFATDRLQPRPAPAPSSYPTPPSQASVSRQGSTVAPLEDAPQSDALLYKRAPSTPTMSLYRNSFLGRGSVTPLDAMDPSGDLAVPGRNASPAASRAGSSADLVKNPVAQPTSREDTAPVRWTINDTMQLRRAVLDATLCPVPLRTLLLLLQVEDRLLNRPTESPRSTAELRKLLAAAPGALEAGDSSSGLLSGSHLKVSTVSVSASSSYRGERFHKRNPVAQLCRSISKGFQRAMLPEEYDNHRHHSHLQQDQQVSNGQQGGGGDDTESDSGEKWARNGQSGVSSRTFKHQYYDPPRSRSLGSTLMVRNPRPANKVPAIKILGVAGLNNLGNTCFMSAALQCLFRSPVLTQYFLTQQFRLDVNSRSPLGSKGKVTEEYARVLSTLYGLAPLSKKALVNLLTAPSRPAAAASTSRAPDEDRSAASVGTTQTGTAPTVCLPPQHAQDQTQRSLVYPSYSLTTLLRLFQAHKPQFSGTDQQDSQEFLCELLDTLHEDLKQAVLTSPVTAPPAGGDSTGTTGPAPSLKSATTSGLEDAKAADTPVPTATANSTTASGSAVTEPATAEQPSTSSATEAATTIATTSAGMPAEGTTRDSPTMSADPTTSVQQQGETRWAKYLDQHSSVVSHLYQGQTCSKIICKVCHNASATFEPFTTLSMPIPRSRNSAAFQHPVDSTTVVLTIYRKMPRLSQILRLPETAFENGTLSDALLHTIYNMSRQPIKLVLHMSRNSSLEQVVARALQAYNAYEADVAAGNSVLRHAGVTGGPSTAQSPSVSRDGSRVLTVGDDLQPQDQQQQQQQQRDTVTETASTQPEGAGGNATERSASGQGQQSEPLPSVPPLSAGTCPATRQSIDHYVPPLVGLNTIVIDVNDKQRGRFGKMLDKREVLQTLQDEATGECHLLLQERCKDISFVASLQAARLSFDYERRYLAELGPNAASGRKSTCFSSLLDFFDTHEYDLQHVLYNNSLRHEGRLLADFDYTYDPRTYPDGGEGSVASAVQLPAEAPATPGTRRKQGGPSVRLAAQQHQDQQLELHRRSADHTYSSRKPWPASLAQFQVGDRVDAVDYKGAWYPGSVIDILYLTEKDIKAHSLTRYTRDFMRKDQAAASTSVQAGAGAGREACTPGLHMRVHFDGFKATWDEWYDQRDFNRGFLAPVYTKASRKLKMHEIPVIQRKLVYTTTPKPSSSENSSSNNGSGTLTSLFIEIMDTPSFVQAESYRTCMHLANHLHEQMLRYVDDDALMAAIDRPAGDERHPFMMRLLSFDNLLAPPIDHYCPVLAPAPAPAEGAESGGLVCQSNTSPGVEFSVADRFNGHKNWEGSALPLDVVRPVFNIYHSKLAIAVDWFVHADTQPNSHNVSTDSMTSGNGQALVPKASGLLHERMPYRQDPSYVSFLKAQRERAATAQQATQRAKEQQLREEEFRREAEGKASANIRLSEAEENVLAYRADNRGGLTIEDVLSKFVRSEDIEEYHCNHCKRPTSGKLHFSIHTLPDVLILHLQRLVMSANGGGKIRTLVRFPLSQLDMQPFTTEQKEYVTQLAELAADCTPRPGEEGLNTNSGSAKPSPTKNGASHGNTSGGGDGNAVSRPQQQQGDGGNSNHSGAENKHSYDLFGVVNHIGGMYGGHYVALSKVEEVALQDTAALRAYHTAQSGAPDSSEASLGAGGLADPLSLQEFISTTAPAGLSAASPTVASASCHTSSGIPEAPGFKWLKFDDEFVNALPSDSAATLHSTVVTDSAYLLFYKRRHISDKNIMKYL